MSKYKIGTTEAGDAGLDLSWEERLSEVDAAVIITKQITKGFHDAALRNADRVIVHATVTGYGGSILEPNVPTLKDEYNAVNRLVEDGFPKEKVVIRIDPIIPTETGIQTAETVFLNFMDSGFSRFRISLIDMYPHVRSRFKKAGVKLPYGNDSFSPTVFHVEDVDKMLITVRSYWTKTKKRTDSELRIEACAEPDLKNVIHCGCISDYDLDLFGLYDENSDCAGFQRKYCMCYSGKTELLKNKKRCGHQCLYCYWK